MNLNTYEWKEFKIPSLFDVCPGKYYSKDSYDEGKTPYISASDTHNGISSMTNLEPDFTGNKITIGKIGATAYYQSQPFCATSDVNVLTPKFKMSPFVGLFISRIINYSENYKWSYGRQCRVGDTNKIVIKLPIKYRLLDGGKTKEPIIDESYEYSEKGYIPDWDFMEDYIKSLHSRPLTTKNKQYRNPYLLDIGKWKRFKLRNLFDNIYKAIPHHEINLIVCDKKDTGALPYITRTEENNGCKCYVLNENFDDIEMGNAIAIGDTTSTISYQKDRFLTGDHIVILRADWLNIYTGLFIVTLLQKERFKYSYGRAFKKDIILETEILLPVKWKDKVNEDDKDELIIDTTYKYSPKGYIPDWKFMENYIKSLPYGDKL